MAGKHEEDEELKRQGRRERREDEDEDEEEEEEEEEELERCGEGRGGEKKKSGTRSCARCVCSRASLSVLGRALRTTSIDRRRRRGAQCAGEEPRARKTRVLG